MSDPKRKAGLGEISARFAKAATDDDEAPPSSEGGDDTGYEAARDELADVLGVGEDQRAAFGDALKAFVMNCR